MTNVQPRRILVVDDDPEVRGLLARVLGKAGLQVDLANDGSAGLALAREHQHPVILLDLLMPGVSGFDVLSQLPTLPYEAPPVVLVITGADRSATEVLDGRQIHGVVRKPFDVEEVASIVAACVEIRSRNSYGTMAIATMMAGGPILALLNRFSS